MAVEQSLADNISDEITPKALYYIHIDALKNGNNNDKTLQIVEVFGGIDNIIAHYLIQNKNDNMKLTQNQLNKLHQLISQPHHKHQPQNRSKPSIKINDKNKKQPLENINNENNTLYHQFDEKNNFLYYLCGSTKANTISNVFLSKTIMKVIFTLLFVTWCILRLIVLVGDVSSIHFVVNIYQISISCLLIIPCEVMFILSSNRTAFALCTKSFEFWFKIIYGVIFEALILITAYDSNKGFKNILGIIIFATEMITLSFVTIIVSSFDAINIGKHWKILFSFGASCTFFMSSINFQFFKSQSDDYTIYLSSTNSEISFYSLISSAGRILAIFFLKQSILTMIQRRGRAVVIKCAPFIEWDSISNNDEIKEKMNMNINDGSQEQEHDNNNEVNEVNLYRLRQGKNSDSSE